MAVAATTPFGRGRTTAAITFVCLGMLTLARAYGAGPYGFAGVPFLFGVFVVNGVIAGRGVGVLVGRVWSMGAWVLGVPTAVAVFLASGVAWNTTPSDRPLLVRLFAITAAAALLWAVAASRRDRAAARLTAGGAAAFLVIAAVAGL